MVPTPDGASSANDNNLQNGQVFVLHHEELEAASVHVLLSHTQSTFNVSSLICLGRHSKILEDSQSVLTPSEYCVMLFRKCNLHANEREVVLGVEDQLIATQLCIAELNKKITGDFDVEVSKVLEFNKRLQIVKLKVDNDAGRDTADASELDSSLIHETVCSGSDVDFDSFIHQYTDFLKFNNNTDLMDVITRLQKELSINEELQKIIQCGNFLFLDTPKDKIESAIFSLLATDKQIHCVRLEESLVSADSQATIEKEQIKFEVTNINCILNTIPADVFPRSSKLSLTEHYIEKLILGYLHLLVNTRSEIALARVINVPERGINQEAFTEIKHMAHIKQLAMYQTVTSFVLKSRLGGQKNTCINSKLSQHIKGLSEFTDMMHKLQTIIEEDLDTRSAVRRVLNVIKKIIISCHDNTLRHSSIAHVTDHLQGYATSVINVMQTIINNSPDRSVSVGGSLVGRQSLKILRCILDHAATQPPLSSILDTLTDIVSSQKTPLKFPSIMSQFRSPIEASPHTAESRSLAERINEKRHVEKRPKMQCNSFLDWAKPIHDTGINEGNQSQFARDCYLPSKTIVHPGSKCLEAVMDQENICGVLPEKHLSAANNTHPYGSDTIMKHNMAASSKRPLNDTVNETNPKRIKMVDSVATGGKKTKTSRRKLVPLSKGQKTLNAFFRI